MKISICLLVISIIYLRIECKTVPKDDDLITDEEEGKQYLIDANEKLRVELNKYSTAEWNYATDINDQTSAERVFKSLTNSEINQILIYNYLQT